jgi:drug/metabolite transporter (DMT)-like permease
MYYVIFLSLIISLLWAVYNIIQKHLLLNLSFEIILYLSATIYSWIITILYYDKVFDYSNHQNISLWLGFLLVINIVLCVTLPNILFNHLLVHHDVSLVSILVSFSPIWAIILAIFIYEEHLNLTQWFGIILSIIGIILVTQKN